MDLFPIGTQEPQLSCPAERGLPVIWNGIVSERIGEIGKIVFSFFGERNWLH